MLKKGQVVEFVMEDRKHLGRVTRGGSGTVNIAFWDAAKKELFDVRGHADAFTPVDKPLPVRKPSCMNRYQVEKFKLIPGHDDSMSFVAEITFDGLPFARVYNDGWGGPNMYQKAKGCNVYGPTWRKLEKDFYEDCKKWFAEHGIEAPVEAEDCWVYWETCEAPYGKTSDEYMAGWNEVMDRFYKNTDEVAKLQGSAN